MNENPEKTATVQPWQHMSARDFAAWGVEDIAYVRPITVDGKLAWAICGADGTGIGVAEERELAFAAARQHDLEPFSVH